MKKLALSLLVAGSFASADFLSVSAGAGVWQENISGYVKNGDTINYMNKKSAETDGDNKTGNLGLQDKNQPYIWVKLIHPIPIIPNVKLQYTKYSTSGDGIASGKLKIFDRTIAYLNDKIHTDLDINSYDATLFYEFKPVVVDLEAGVGVNVLLTDTTVTSKTTQQTSSASTVAPIPYLYARAETMQFLGFSIEAEGKYLNVSGTGHYFDYSSALKYHLPLPVLDIYASAGYRYQDILGEDGDNETKLQFKGAFAEIGVKF
jgi:outer membrane protein